MFKTLTAIVFSAMLVFGAGKSEPSASEVDEIIRKFAEKESQFLKARERYTYRQTARIVELDEFNRQGGKYEIVSDIIFSAEGKRTERILRAPVSTLRNISLSPEDEQDLRSVQPFALTSENIDKYHVRYLGKETLDEIPCYSFSVKPKAMEKGQRYFSGIAWVDDRDLQIVKTYGRGVGLLKKGSDQAFPKFETYREQIDGVFWFPTYTIANDVLQFESGLSQRIRMTVKYEDYKQFTADTKITFGDPVNVPPDEKKDPTEEPKPEPKKQ